MSENNSLVVNDPLGRRRKSSTSFLAEKLRRLFLPNCDSESETESLAEQSQPTIDVRDPMTEDDNLWEPNKYTKDLIIRTWCVDFDSLYEVGTEIYQKIFENVPEYVKLFPFLAKYEENWHDCPEFRRQALRFVQVISEGVRNLHRLTEFKSTTLYNVGRAHCKYADRGFRPQYWEVFQNAVKKTMKSRVNEMSDLTSQQKKDVVKAWYYLSEQIIQGMQKGFNDGMKAGSRKCSF